MGISSFWKLLQDEGVLERYSGARAEDHARIMAAVDGKVIATAAVVKCSGGSCGFDLCLEGGRGAG